MSRIFTFVLTCMIIGVLSTSILAETQVDKSTYLYLKIGNGSAFTRYSRTDTMLTIARLPLQVKFNDPAFADSIVEGVTIKFFFDRTRAEFKSVTLDTGWAGSASATVLTVGSIDTVTVRLRGGTGKPSSNYKTYAYLNLSPICQPFGDTVTMQIKFSTKPETDDYISLHNGYVFAPFSSNQTLGVLSRSGYTGDGFEIPDDSLSNVIGEIIEVPVRGITSSRVGAILHQILVDANKLQYVGAIFSGRWNGLTFDEVNGDTILIYVENNSLNGTPELTMDSAIYTMRFRVTSAAANSTTDISFLDDSCHYRLPGCPNWKGTAIYLSGSVTVSDHAGIVLQPQTAGPCVLKRDTVVRYNMKLQNTFDAGIQHDALKGIKVAFSFRNPAFRLASPDPSTSNYLWDYATSDGKAVIWQYDTDTLNQSGERFVAACPDSFAKLTGVDLEWNGDRAQSFVWTNQYIHPACSLLYSYDTTRVPAFTGTWVAKLGAGLDSAAFTDSIKVLMAQPATTDTTKDSAPCVWQTLKIRNNFSLARCSLVVECPTGATLGDSIILRSGLHVLQINTRRWAIYGTLASAIAPSSNYTDLARIRIDRGSCNGQWMTVSLDLVSSKVELLNGSTYMEAYTAAFSKGTATTRCYLHQFLCGEIIEPRNPTDVGDDNSGLPKEFALKQNYPNPFNPTTTISLDLPTRADWKITIYNISGQVVKTFEGSSGAGVINVVWNASACASGIYLYKAEAGTFVETRKMLLIK